MNPDFNSETPVDSPPARMVETRPMYWSVRRELWENRSIYIAPLLVAAVVLFATLISTLSLPRRIRNASALEPAKRHAVIVTPYSMAPAPIILVTFIVGIFYSLDALYGERRDRSILFWKSLPVSDRTTVLSKAAIPLVVLPLIGIAIGLAMQFVLLLLSTPFLLGNGVAGTVWSEFRFIQEPFVMLYGLTVFALWYAPVYGWLLLVSAWARRAAILWAVLPLLAVSAVEKILFNTMHFMAMLQYRMGGAMKEAFAFQPKHGSNEIIDQLTQLDPAKFLTRPALWFGLAFAAVFIAAAIRLRRNREPI